MSGHKHPVHESVAADPNAPPEPPAPDTPAESWQKIAAKVREELAKADLCAMDGPGCCGGSQMMGYLAAVKQAMENEAAALAFGNSSARGGSHAKGHES